MKRILLIVGILIVGFQYCYGIDSLRTKTDFACIASKNLESNLQDIIATPKKYVSDINDDKCVLNLLDSISKYAIVKKDTNYLRALNAICKSSDGYVSDAIMEICRTHFYENFNAFVNYCYARKSCLRGKTIEGLSMEISVSENKKLAEHRLDKFINDHLRRMRLEKDKVDFVKKIRKEVDPKMFD